MRYALFQLVVGAGVDSDVFDHPDIAARREKRE